MNGNIFPLFLVFSAMFLWVSSSLAVAKEINLEQLEPLNPRVYEVMSDPDSRADKEGLIVTPWQMSDRDTGEKRYKSGLKFTTVSSWSVARMAVDYMLENGGYHTFSGKIVPHESARNSRTLYTVRIIGDDKILYISNMITPRTPPQHFSIDVSSVKKMVIEARGSGNDNRFYTNSYFGIVDATLTLEDAGNCAEAAAE